MGLDRGTGSREEAGFPRPRPTDTCGWGGRPPGVAVLGASSPRRKSRHRFPLEMQPLQSKQPSGGAETRLQDLAAFSVWCC